MRQFSLGAAIVWSNIQVLQQLGESLRIGMGQVDDVCKGIFPLTSSIGDEIQDRNETE